MNHSITRRYSLICSVESSLMKPQMNYKTQAAVQKLLVSGIVSIHQYLPYYNLSFHVLSSKDAVAGNRRQLGGQTQRDCLQQFGLNSINSSIEVICKLSLPFLSLCTVNTVTHSYDTSNFIPQLFLAKDRQNSGHFFRNQYNFSLFLHAPNFIFHLLGGHRFGSKCIDTVRYYNQTSFL